MLHLGLAEMIERKSGRLDNDAASALINCCAHPAHRTGEGDRDVVTRD